MDRPIAHPWEPPPEAIKQLEANGDHFVELITAAESVASVGASLVALTLGDLAARYAGANHGGIIASAELERLVERVGLDRVRSESPRMRPRTVRRVLHVLTQGGRVGGHTRLAANWMRQDRARRHDVALLDQTAVLPVGLVDAARVTGGRVRDLTRLRPGYLRQAAALAVMARKADVIVLHHSGFDIVPGLAFADAGSRPPTILLNHVSRPFATGFAVADVVVALRPSIRDLLVPRRGVPPSRVTLLPIPLGDPVGHDRHRELRHETRTRLGIPDHGRCIFTMANEVKFRPVDEVSLPLLLAGIVGRHDELFVIAVGPKAEGDWQHAEESSNGRVRALGIRPDPRPFLAAADVAIDSYPMSSETAVREAAAAGLPLVSFTRLRSAAPASCIDFSGGADDLVVRAPDPESLRTALVDLCADDAARARLSAATRDAVNAESTGTRWKQTLESVYARAVASDTPMTSDQMGDPLRTADALDAITVLTNQNAWTDDEFRLNERRILGDRPTRIPSGAGHPVTVRARHASVVAASSVRRLGLLPRRGRR